MQREIAATPQIVSAIDGPAQRAMVNHQVIHVIGIERVIAALGAFRLVLIPKAAAQIADDDIRGVSDLKRIILERDAVPGRGLTRNRDRGFLQDQFAFQFNRSRHLEHNRSRSRRGPESLAK